MSGPNVRARETICNLERRNTNTRAGGNAEQRVPLLHHVGRGLCRACTRADGGARGICHHSSRIGNLEQLPGLQYSGHEAIKFHQLGNRGAKLAGNCRQAITHLHHIHRLALGTCRRRAYY